MNNASIDFQDSHYIITDEAGNSVELTKEQAGEVAQAIQLAELFDNDAWIGIKGDSNE